MRQGVSPPIEVHDARYHLANMPLPDNPEMCEQSQRLQLSKSQTSDLQMPLPNPGSQGFAPGRDVADERTGRANAVKEDVKREIVLGQTPTGGS